MKIFNPAYITPKIVEKLGDNLGDVNISKLMDIINKYHRNSGIKSWPGWLKELNKKELINLYKDLIELKNGL